jgi:histidine triad (HIT) family protein
VDFLANCIFCQIASGEIETERVYEDDQVVAFPDINPQAPVHLLIIPRRHIGSLMDLPEGTEELIGRIHRVIIKLAKDFNIHQSGFRVITNCGRDAGQAVFHLHFHLLGGGPLPLKLG